MPNVTDLYELPYPDGTEPVSSLDTTGQELAELLDLLLGETGSTTITAAGAGVVTKRVNYARDYTALGFTPRAQVQLSTSHADTVLYVELEDATGFTLGLRTAGAGSLTRTVRWFVRGAL
jgi:hypothetical protein